MCPGPVDAAAPPGAAALTDASLRQELLDELDEGAVAWELLTSWALLEAKELRTLSMAKPQGLPQHLREAALRFLHALAESLSMRQSGWLDCVLLFDRYCSSGGSIPCTECLPGLCVAIATIVKKHDSSNSSIGAAALTKLATQYAHWLAGMGFAREAHTVLEEEVRRQETIVLTALDWNVTVPSVHLWMGVLCKRFDVLTRGMSSATLDWIYSQSITSAGMLVLREVAFANMTPRAMANGLFCTFLAVAAIVPAQAFRPAKLSEQQWEDLLAESQCRGARPSAAAPPASQSLLGLLQVVAGCGLPTLQADTHGVVLAMRDIAVGLREQGGHCTPQQATVQHSKTRGGRSGAPLGLQCGRSTWSVGNASGGAPADR